MILQDRKRGRPKAEPSVHEERFALQLRAHKLPPPVREHLFAKEALGRKWRFDFAWPDRKVAVEIEGGGPKGQHMRPKGFREDCEKYNAAHELGWRVLRYVGAQIKSGEAVNQIARIITGARL